MLEFCKASPYQVVPSLNEGWFRCMNEKRRSFYKSLEPGDAVIMDQLEQNMERDLDIISNSSQLEAKSGPPHEAQNEAEKNSERFIDKGMCKCS